MEIEEESESLYTGENDNTDIESPCESFHTAQNDNIERQRASLYTAAMKGDWETARGFEEHMLTSKITNIDETALHVAAIAEKVEFVEELVNHIHTNGDLAFLETGNEVGNTALCYAATTGVVSIARIMLEVNEPNEQGHYWLANQGRNKPLSMAALLGRFEMVQYLLERTDLEGWTEGDRTDLLTNCIRFGLCDEALKILDDFPELATKSNQSNETGLYVLARQPSLFLPETQPYWGAFLTCFDREVPGGNMLHLAAELAPPTQLKVVAGAALQMRRELLWFKEVEKIVKPSYKYKLNSAKKTPQMIFDEAHKDLMSAGEKWMTETSKSSMLVAALIATVMFTAAFTVPGGFNNSNGAPIFKDLKWFFIFSLADAFALFCSSTSILMFHSIITSRYTEKDFLESLPFRLMVGVMLLFASVAAMMVAFSATFVMYYPHENVPWIFAIIALFACVPSLYVSLKYPLLVDLIRSNRDSRSMFQPRKQLFL